MESYAAGRRTVLVIDEAQGLSADVLEQVRLLTNLETTREKLLEIILVGQPELRETLARRDLRQLAQRITARYHLKPLDGEEVRHYVHHRLSIAGANRRLFTDGALRRLARISTGIPQADQRGGRPGVARRLCRRAADGRRAADRASRRPGAGRAAAAHALGALGDGRVGTGNRGRRRLVVGEPGIPGLGESGGTVSTAGDQIEAPRPVVVTIQAPSIEAAARATEPVADVDCRWRGGYFCRGTNR